MKKNIKNIAIVVAFFVIIFASIVVACAYLFSQDNLQNTFIPTEVSCKVNEERTGNVKNSVTVQNTSDVGVYLRVVAVTYWQDSKGNIVGKNSKELDWEGMYNSNDWIKGEDNTFYYKYVVNAEDSTVDLLNNESTIELVTDTRVEEVQNADDIIFEYYQVVEFIAEAIQATPQQAVTDSWGVTLDVNGNIDGVAP